MLRKVDECDKDKLFDMLSLCNYEKLLLTKINWLFHRTSYSVKDNERNCLISLHYILIKLIRQLFSKFIFILKLIKSI